MKREQEHNMGPQLRSPHANIVTAIGACVYFLAACFGSGHALAQSGQVGTTVAIENTGTGKEALQTFRDAIAHTESSGGAYGVSLPEQLLSLGLALQKEERHADAVAVFRRGSHLARINNGLHSTAQIPYIQNKIISHLALSQYTEADESQARLFRAQQRALASGEVHVEALLQQARWQKQAYGLEIGGRKASFGRLLNMRDLNRRAFANILDLEGNKSPNLLPPLYGMLQAQYLISSHNHVDNVSSEFGISQMERRFNYHRAKSYDMGQSIIRAVYKIQASIHGEKTLSTAQTRVMMGDWMWWHGMRDSALAAYTNATGELAELDDAQVDTQKLLGVPVALPDLNGVRSLPFEVSAEDGNFLVEFGVTPSGRVVHLVRLQKPGDEQSDTALERRGNRLMRALRKTKFRPSFADGEAVATENIVKAYAITQ